MINPNKPDKLRYACNAAAKFRGIAPNELVFAGPDLLQSLIRISFWSREHEVALSADFGAMFIYIQIISTGPVDDKCLRFLRRPTAYEFVDVYQDNTHFFGA